MKVLYQITTLTLIILVITFDFTLDLPNDTLLWSSPSMTRHVSETLVLDRYPDSVISKTLSKYKGFKILTVGHFLNTLMNSDCYSLILIFM